MKVERLRDIVIKAVTFQINNEIEKDKMLILLTKSDFQSLFNELSKNIVQTNENEIIVPAMYKCYGFEFRPHNVENQDVLICLKHNAK